MPTVASRPRSNNRRDLLLESAAQLFVEKGFSATATRDIARVSGMLPGSLYYHFPSKEDLLIAVYEEGVNRIGRSVDAAVAEAGASPWARLEAACAAHLDMLLGGSDFAHVIARVLPGDAPGAEARLIALRQRYEAHFRRLIADLPLAPGANRSLLRLMLIGAMNHATVWYCPCGDPPRALARKFVAILRHPLTDACPQSPQPDGDTS
jgi:TetR/AcrR family transcriptional regulator, cholesterol catabolism regulator